MTEVIVSKSIKVEAKEAWKTLSSFKGIENFSPIERSITEGEGKGAKRTCYMPDGSAINEELNLVDHDNMVMQYSILEGPFPIADYKSDVKVSILDTDSCEITWACEFNTSLEAQKEMKELFTGFYNVIIDNLESYLKN